MTQAARTRVPILGSLASTWPVTTFSVIVLTLAGLVMLAGLEPEASRSR